MAYTLDQYGNRIETINEDLQWIKFFIYDKKNKKILENGLDIITDNVQKEKNKLTKKYIIQQDIEIDDLYINFKSI